MSDDSPDTDERTVVRRQVLEASPDRVWRALTDPDELAAWWGEGTTIVAEPGGQVHAVDPDGTTRHGVVVEAEHGRRLRLDWWPADDDDTPATRVTIELEPCPFGTVVTVTEAVLVDLVVHPPVFLAPPPPRRARWTGALVLAG